MLTACDCTSCTFAPYVAHLTSAILHLRIFAEISLCLFFSQSPSLSLSPSLFLVFFFLKMWMRSDGLWMLGALDSNLVQPCRRSADNGDRSSAKQAEAAPARTRFPPSTPGSTHCFVGVLTSKHHLDTPIPMQSTISTASHFLPLLFTPLLFAHLYFFTSLNSPHLDSMNCCGFLLFLAFTVWECSVVSVHCCDFASLWFLSCCDY